MSSQVRFLSNEDIYLAAISSDCLQEGTKFEVPLKVANMSKLVETMTEDGGEFHMHGAICLVAAFQLSAYRGR